MAKEGPSIGLGSQLQCWKGLTLSLLGRPQVGKQILAEAENFPRDNTVKSADCVWKTHLRQDGSKTGKVEKGASYQGEWEGGYLRPGR